MGRSGEVMPRSVDRKQREGEIREATLRVLAAHGVRGVTIRRVAAELGASTSVVTHFTADKGELLRHAISVDLLARQQQVTELVSSAKDPLWEVIDWTIEADPTGVWPALVSAAAADIDPAVSLLVRTFDEWWTGVITELVTDRLADGVSSSDAADAIGLVADGLLLALDAGTWTADHRHRLARLLIEPLIAR
jgi:AcrR family transcriptional regulator